VYLLESVLEHHQCMRDVPQGCSQLLALLIERMLHDLNRDQPRFPPTIVTDSFKVLYRFFSSADLNLVSDALLNLPRQRISQHTAIHSELLSCTFAPSIGSLSHRRTITLQSLMKIIESFKLSPSLTTTVAGALKSVCLPSRALCTQDNLPNIDVVAAHGQIADVSSLLGSDFGHHGSSGGNFITRVIFLSSSPINTLSAMSSITTPQCAENTDIASIFALSVLPHTQISSILAHHETYIISVVKLLMDRLKDRICNGCTKSDPVKMESRVEAYALENLFSNSTMWKYRDLFDSELLCALECVAVHPDPPNGCRWLLLYRAAISNILARQCNIMPALLVKFLIAYIRFKKRYDISCIEDKDDILILPALTQWILDIMKNGNSSISYLFHENEQLKTLIISILKYRFLDYRLLSVLIEFVRSIYVSKVGTRTSQYK
jgi:hypothetical protein